MFSQDGLLLRKVNRSDLKDLYWLKQESWFGTHRVAIVNMENQEAWFNALDSDPHCPSSLVLIAEADGSGEIVGVFKIADIDYISRVADVGWDVFESMRGMGYGKKLVKVGVAFCKEILNLRRLNAEILATNDTSKACARNAGFVHEGTKRSCIYKSGKYIDSETWGYLDE